VQYPRLAGYIKPAPALVCTALVAININDDNGHKYLPLQRSDPTELGRPLVNQLDSNNLEVR